jgi:Zn-dependent protease/CBS domain-containing protein
MEPGVYRQPAKPHHGIRSDVQGGLSRRSQPKVGATPFGPGIRIARLFGFEIRLDFSVLLIVALLIVNLGAGVFAAWHPGWSPLLRWSVAVAAAILFLGSILIHELTHALVGRRLGVEIVGITLFLFGGLARMKRDPDRASAEFWMAVSGPLASIALGLASLAAGSAIAATSVGISPEDPATLMQQLDPVSTLLLWLGPLNVFLGIFNLLPGFPLDGGRVLRALVWWSTGDLSRATRIAGTAGLVIAWCFIGLGILMAFGIAIPLLGVGFAPGLWLVLIGWFLSSAARASVAQRMMTDRLTGVPVERLMWRRAETVAPGTSIDRLVREQVLHSEQHCFPVAADGMLDGIVCLEDIRKIPEESWHLTTVDQVMTRRQDLMTLERSDDAARALELLGTLDLGQLPVVEDGRFLGLVRRQELMKWLTIREPSRAPDLAA